MKILVVEDNKKLLGCIKRSFSKHFQMECCENTGRRSLISYETRYI